MFGLSFITDAWIVTFLYVFLRFAGMVIISPIFGRGNLPGMFRAGFCLMMSIIIMMILPEGQYAAAENYLVFFINGVKEVILGLIMGYITLMTLSAALAAGHLIDMQIGFGLSNFFDRHLGMDIALTGNLLNIIYTLLFFMTNGHHSLIMLMFGSFRLISPGNVVFGLEAVRMLVLYFGWFILLVIKICLPVIAVAIAVEFGLGIIMKTMPQMNMFVVGIPLKLVMGIIVMMLFLSAFMMLSQDAFNQMFEWYQKIIAGLIPA